MPPKKGPATPRGSPKKKASPAATHRTGPWVIGAYDAKTAPDADAASDGKKQVDPAYDPVLFAISTPPSSRRSSPARSPKQPRGEEHTEAYDFHRLVKAKIQGNPIPEGIIAAMVSEDANARATTPPRKAATSTAASSTFGLTEAQLVPHEAARLNDPYAAADAQAAAAPSAVSSEPFSEPAPSPGAQRYAKAMRILGDERRRCKGCDSYFCETAGCASPRHYEDDDVGGVSPMQPFSALKTVLSRSRSTSTPPASSTRTPRTLARPFPHVSAVLWERPCTTRTASTSRTPTRLLTDPLNKMTKIPHLMTLNAPRPRPTKPSSCR